MKKLTALCVLAVAALFQFAHAAESPVGKWTTIDDETNEPKSVVEIWLDGSELKGKIVSLLKEEDKGKICTKCKGKLKNQPIEGLNFIWGLKEDDGEWTGGKILDPGKGKEYKAKIVVTNGGQNLDVRGFIGFALIGRTQTWNRMQ